MDYKEEYKKALERAKGLADFCSDNELKTLKYVFHELKESEDERIIKAIISILKSYFEKNTIIYGISVGDIIAWLEKQGEQNLADKVEPRFKVGDWVVYDHRAYQVIELPKEGYINLGLRRNGKTEFAPSPYCKHWTIQDAKDGDVLSYRGGQWCFIYKGIATEDTFKYYALLSEKGITVNDTTFSLLTSCIIPATKEQCDLLLQKMHEAGYEWDANKKKLKKIEQNLTWNAEDEYHRNIILYVLNNEIVGKEDKENAINWLKSLKGRHTWKPSDEQMKTFEYYIDADICNKDKEILFGLYAGLKKLMEEVD